MASEIILEAVQRVARKKPVIAFVDRVAASGGYMAALGAREIWATPHAIVGSIGVFGEVRHLRAAGEARGAPHAHHPGRARACSPRRGASPSASAS
ncbi:S49 family peptidase [Cystobacter fuscus]